MDQSTEVLAEGGRGSGGIPGPPLSQGSPWIAPANPSAPRVQFVSHRQACAVGTGSPETRHRTVLEKEGDSGKAHWQLGVCTHYQREEECGLGYCCCYLPVTSKIPGITLSTFETKIFFSDYSEMPPHNL